MGFKNPDGTFNDKCLEKVNPGEPIFVLRGQDKFAPALVRLWVELAEMHVCNAEKVDEALAIADVMEEWEVRKFPD
ncbi:MAG: hypothetical protein FVQ81_13120 [Candidatus Glassbacteria bacterium]|nr:hypothetical protein [Candidatus Glassbacteria bacterium]